MIVDTDGSARECGLGILHAVGKGLVKKPVSDFAFPSLPA